MSRKIYQEKLLQLRSKLAYETKGNHSWSFSDKELESLLEAEPRTFTELIQLKGFPADGKRVKAFGQQIIDIFNGEDIKDFDVKVSNDDVIVKTVLKQSSAFSNVKLD